MDYFAIMAIFNCRKKLKHDFLSLVFTDSFVRFAVPVFEEFTSLEILHHNYNLLFFG